MQWRVAIAGLMGLGMLYGSAFAEVDYSNFIQVSRFEGLECGECACSSGCDACACDTCCEPQRFLGLLSSDHCFDRFISPISNPFFFEDPRSLTEARGIYIDNDVPAELGGGYASVWAGQLRGRISERWSVIAPRLAYLEPHNSTGASGGFLSAPIGFKYNLVRDIENQFLASAGITYFIPGSENLNADRGDGDFHFFLTAGKEIFGSGHWLSATGFRIPADGNWGTQLWYWSNQWDYELPGHIYPLVGVNWFHWMRSSGNDLTSFVSGMDLINLAAGDVAGDNVVTGVVGVKWKPSGNLELGGGYEFPLTERTDILYDRLYADLILRF